MKFGSRFRNSLAIKCMKLYSNAFKFDIFIAGCLGISFITGHSVEVLSMVKQGSVQVNNVVEGSTQPD